MDEVCCVNSINLIDSKNFPSSTRGSKGRDSEKYLGKYTNKFKNSSILKNLPLNEIDYFNFKHNSKKEFKSLKALPINTQNIIRKQAGNPLDYYDVIKKIGKGTFGVVYKVIHKATGSIRAMKVIPKNNLKYGFTDEDIIHEINILKTLEHPHIIKLYEFFTFKKNYYLINEFCTEGDLSEKLDKLKSFPEFFVKILMFQIFNAVKYLNEKNVIHGDLKLENIMIDSYLNNGELVPVNKNSNFISSLLEDEKEMNEYLRKNMLKRAITYNIAGLKKYHVRRIKGDSNNINNNDNDNENIDSVHKLIKIRIKRRKTLSDLNQLKFGKNKNQENKKESNKPSDNETNNIKDEADKNCFKYLNGEEYKEEVERKDNVENNLKNEYRKLKPNGMENNKNNDNNNVARLKKKNKMKIFKIKKSNITFLPTIKETEESKCEKENYDSMKSNEISKLKRASTINLNSMKIKNFELKLIDFGCSKIFSKYKKNFKDTIGTLIYCSPEVLKNNYNKKCDIWSCGVLMYVLLSGHFPFFAETEKEITKKILSGKFEFNKKYFKNISNKAKDLISKCLIYDKNKRISVEEALKHEFFADDLNPNNIFEDEIDSKNALISLKNYSPGSKIYQTVLAFLSHNFAKKEQLNKLTKIFYKIDLNLDGKLSKEELNTAFKEAGMEMEKDQLNKVIESVDFDRNGFIEYEEFIRVTLPKDQLFTEKNLKTAFDMFDLDKNGSISLNEFKEILGLGKIKDKNVIKELLKEIPIKGNEEINFAQFKKILL